MSARDPNLIIAGVNKAGTTSVFSYLAQHPGICGSAVKETCYFLPIRYGEELEPLERYRAHFGRCDHPVRLEATPGYFYGGEALAERIAATLDGVRVLLMFREPIDRLRSFFTFQQSMLALDADLTLDAYVERCLALTDDELRRRDSNPWFGVEGGRYDRHFPAWSRTFGDRLGVVFFEELRDDRRALLIDLCRWLELDPTPFESADLDIENRTVGFRNPTLQRLALAANRRGERLWRRAPAVKRLLKRGYRALNGRATDRNDDAALRARLETLYRPHNRAFAEQLHAHGVGPLPSWLEG